jgi:hypothetical protein
MSQSLWCPLAWLNVQGGGEGLCDSRVQGGGSARDDQAGIALVPRRRTLAGARSKGK